MQEIQEYIHFQVPSISINQKTIVDHASISLKKGSWTALMGKSGAGKTLFLKSLSQNPGVTYVSQNERLIPWLTIEKNISLSSLISSTKHTYLDVNQLLEAINLVDKKHAYPHEISYGMQTRVLLARALYQGAEVFLLDEIFNGLDEDTKYSVYQSVREILKNKTVLLVTHSRTDAAAMAESIYSLKGSPAALEMSRVAA